MPIPMKKYIAITSAIAKTDGATRKELIPRIFTKNTLAPINTVLEFLDAPAVGEFFGTLSQEYKIAVAYFGWVSKVATQAKKISFMRYSFEAQAPNMYSTKKLADLAILKAVSDGSMTINLGGTSYVISSINLSGADSYNDIATILQTAIRANTQGGALYTSATVTYNPTNTSFILTGGTTGANNIGYCEAGTTGTDLSNLIGWNVSSAPVLSVGVDTQTIDDILNKTIDLSTNFLTFGFVEPADCYSNLAAIGAWVTAQNNNYRCCFDLSSANYMEGIEIAKQYQGMTAHYNVNYGISNIIPAWLMSAILPATTNYNKVNGVKNYMFQEFPAQPIAVGNNDGNLYQTLDNLLINYNGQTQKSGRNISFYQNGFNTDGTDSAVFDNEAWLKDAITTDLMNAFLGLDFISADNDGIAILTSVLTNNAEESLNNHVFSTGKILTNTQKAYITQVSGDDMTWLDVQNNGYWFEVHIETEASGNATIYKGVYTLIYLKNDTIRKVEGSNILI